MRWPRSLSRLGAAGREMLAALDRAVLPLVCVFCGVRCEPFEAGLCAGCAADLPWNDNACPGCALPLDASLTEGLHCAACQATPPPFAAAAAPLCYEFPVDAALKRLKFRRRLEYVPVFARLLAASLETLPGDIDRLVPVPLHWRRQAIRGFNQAGELCRDLSRLCNLPVSRVARRRRATQAQAGLDARARARNLQGAFHVADVSDARHVLVVDDVITTGATCRELAIELRRAGAGQVSVLAVARRAAGITQG